MRCHAVDFEMLSGRLHTEDHDNHKTSHCSIKDLLKLLSAVRLFIYWLMSITKGLNCDIDDDMTEQKSQMVYHKNMQM